MKKSNFLLGAAAALAMGAAFTSCSDDDIKGIDNGKADHDMTRYLSVTICTPNGAPMSKATTDADFEKATANENYIHSLYFVFFDANGENLNYQDFHFKNNTNTDNGEGGTFNPEGNDSNPDATGGNIGKVYTTVVPVEMTTGQNMPSYVMAFINPVTPAEIINASMSDIDKLLRQQVQAEEDAHFPMSNSVYYGTNPITGNTNVRMVATPITLAQLFSTREDAQKATGGEIVNIYVERYAAKINLSLKPSAIAECTDVKDYSLTFVPEYWRPNAIDKDIYVMKHFAIHADGLSTDDPTYKQLNKRLTNDENTSDPWWNDANKKRSYWGCTPAYWAMNYPKVSDDILDNNGEYKLHYFSYNEIKNSTLNGNATSQSIAWIPLQEGQTDETNAGFTSSFYARETTTSANVWQNATNYNPMASVASALIIGHYKVKNSDGDELPEGTTFYLYGKTNVKETVNGEEKSVEKWNLYENEADAIAAMVPYQNIVLEPETHQPTQKASLFTLKHPDKEVRQKANATVASRLVALQLTDEANGYDFYDVKTSKYVPIGTSNITEVNAALLTAGYATQYGNSLACFNIPIRHLNYKTQSGDINVANYNFKEQPAGAFGIVRNHVYNINISKISGLGTAIRDKDQPVVPPMDEQTYFIKAVLSVLNWRIVPTQEVEL